MVLFHCPDTASAVPALMKSTTLQASRFVDIEYLPVILGAVMAAFGHPERSTDAAPYSVDWVLSHCIFVAGGV
jgi:hypothetical protein